MYFLESLDWYTWFKCYNAAFYNVFFLCEYNLSKQSLQFENYVLESLDISVSELKYNVTSGVPDIVGFEWNLDK